MKKLTEVWHEYKKVKFINILKFKEVFTNDYKFQYLVEILNNNLLPFFWSRYGIFDTDLQIATTGIQRTDARIKKAINTRAQSGQSCLSVTPLLDTQAW